MINSILNTCMAAASLDPSVRVVAAYSHTIPVLFILSLSLLVFIKAKKSLLSKVFMAFSAVFSLWLVGDLIAWTSNNYYLIYAAWSLLVYTEIVFFILGLSFVIMFVRKRDLSMIEKILLFGLTLVPLVITITQNSVVGFYHPVCEAFNNAFLDQYKLYLEMGILITILGFIVYSLFSNLASQTKKSNLIVLGSMFLFLGVFGVTEYLSALTGYYELHLYSLFIVPLFLIAIIYSIFTLDIFNVKVVSTYFLVFGFLILTASQLFFVTGSTDRLLTTITLVLSSSLAILLFRNLKKESDQRTQIAKLNSNLKDLIKQRENLVHLVTHKVKGSFTRSKYIFACMLDGTFGEVSPEIKKRAEQGLESDKMGIQTVDLVLNVANMQNGIIKYDMKNLDLKEIVVKLVAEKSGPAEKRGLKLNTQIHDGQYQVLGDAFWLKEAVANLLDNSIKYTKEGSIDISLENQNGKIVLKIQDTGIGITPEDKENLFTEGGRGKDSVKINVDSTGYGLYSVKLILDAHKGRVWAESEGAGKGSTFYMEVTAA